MSTCSARQSGEGCQVARRGPPPTGPGTAHISHSDPDAPRLDEDCWLGAAKSRPVHPRCRHSDRSTLRAQRSRKRSGQRGGPRRARRPSQPGPAGALSVSGHWRADRRAHRPERAPAAQARLRQGLANARGATATARSQHAAPHTPDRSCDPSIHRPEPRSPPNGRRGDQASASSAGGSPGFSDPAVAHPEVEGARGLDGVRSCAWCSWGVHQIGVNQMRLVPASHGGGEDCPKSSLPQQTA